MFFPGKLCFGFFQDGRERSRIVHISDKISSDIADLMKTRLPTCSARIQLLSAKLCPSNGRVELSNQANC